MRLGRVSGHDATHYPLSLMVRPGDRAATAARLPARPVRSRPASRLWRSGWCGCWRLRWRAGARDRQPGDAVGVGALDHPVGVERHGAGGGAGACGPTLPQLFSAQAARTPDAVAVVFEDRRLRYAELEAHANQLAHHLRGRGVGPETVVGLCVERSPEMVIGLLGILKAGGAYLPLDPSYPPERLSFMLRDAGAAVLVTQAALLERLTPPGAAIEAGATGARPSTVVRLDADWAEVARQPTQAPPSSLDPQHPAYVIYTSGSTGTPKGVVVTHGELAQHDAGDGQPVRRRRRRSGCWRLLTRLRCIVEQSSTFRCIGGAAVVLSSRAVRRIAVARSGGRSAGRRDHSCRRRRRCGRRSSSEAAGWHGRWRMLVGGEALARAELRGEIRGSCRSQQLTNLYGPTETTIGAVAMALPTASRCRIPIGRPIWNTRVYVLDAGLGAGACGCCGRALHRGSGSGAGLSGACRADGGAVRRRPAWCCGGRPDVPERGPGAVACGRCA